MARLTPYLPSCHPGNSKPESASVQRNQSRKKRKPKTALALSSQPIEAGPQSAWTRTSVLLGALLIVILTFVTYLPAWHGDFIWDDDYYLTNNPLLTAPDGLQKIWFSLQSPSQYFPLVYTLFRIERAFWGLNPTGYHFVNLFLHVANALLVWRLLARLKVPGAWLAGIIFALHPVQVESVAWITECKNVLMGFFFLLTLLNWIEFIDPKKPSRPFFYALALLFYALALSAKSTACTLPVALLLILWWQRKPIAWPRILQTAPFVLLGLAMGIIAIWWERFHQGTRGTSFTLNPLERVLVASRAVWFYLGKLLWPADLMFSYPKWNIDTSDSIAYGWILATGALGVVIYFARRKAGRGIEVATIFFVATLAPMLGFIMLYTFRYTFVADHYQYLACLGPIALLCAGIVRWTEANERGRYLRWIPAALLIATLSLLSWRQSSNYRDIETLWRATIAKNPGCWMAYNNLGSRRLEERRHDEAIGYLEKALELKPDLAEAQYNLGNCFLAKGESARAIQPYQASLQVRPNDTKTRTNLAICLATIGRTDEAIAEFEETLRSDPGSAEAHYNLGYLFKQLGRQDEALLHLREAVRLKPDYGQALEQLRELGVPMPRPGTRS